MFSFSKFPPKRINPITEKFVYNEGQSSPVLVHHVSAKMLLRPYESFVYECYVSYFFVSSQQMPYSDTVSVQAACGYVRY